MKNEPKEFINRESIMLYIANNYSTKWGIHDLLNVIGQIPAEEGLIYKQAALDKINSYGGADATDPEDKRIDGLVRAIYADVDSIETID